MRRSAWGRSEGAERTLPCLHARPEIAGYAGARERTPHNRRIAPLIGHVSHGVARNMVKSGLVTGIELDEDSVPSVCHTSSCCGHT